MLNVNFDLLFLGLTNQQLRQVFTILDNQQNAMEIYESWISKVPPELVDVSIKSYTGINLSDPKQRNEIVFPLFRRNMSVIDFWLSNLVFPHEAKTFENKLMCTAWDLCNENLVHVVSGFSGTNDTKNILPLPISQNDLEELEQTNDNVRDILLLEENQSYVQLPANVSGMSILVELVQKQIPVLLDAGALMLELNNEQVAKEWLKLVPVDKFDAAVYFSAKDVLMTIDRNDLITEFDNSVYRDKLDRCVVYLDDVHTRGTDLKFPNEWRACVTLSGEITRDKTVQACMRMRLLGKGHRISFWAAFEADMRIRDICQIGENKPTNKDVIQFICTNSKRFEEENTIHWASAGYNYAKKIVAHKLNENDILVNDQQAPLRYMYDQIVDNEFITLNDCYGGKENAPVTQIVNARFMKLNEMFVQARNPDAALFVARTRNKVDQKLVQNAADLKRYTQSLDEEQEKELEHEMEEERQGLFFTLHFMYEQ